AAELLIAGTRDASSWRYLRCMSGGHAPTISRLAPQPRVGEPAAERRAIEITGKHDRCRGDDAAYGIPRILGVPI
ncbi:hypothetical protein, partial [Burkholderia vietnamiensis]|uniref:hypothetical protein n=1 Tax=Burkholderia vietnamiensis TaxID=60552 RepID=UPI001ABB5EE1